MQNTTGATSYKNWKFENIDKWIEVLARWFSAPEGHLGKEKNLRPDKRASVNDNK